MTSTAQSPDSKKSHWSVITELTVRGDVEQLDNYYNALVLGQGERTVNALLRSGETWHCVFFCTVPVFDNDVLPQGSFTLAGQGPGMNWTRWHRLMHTISNHLLLSPRSPAEEELFNPMGFYSTWIQQLTAVRNGDQQAWWTHFWLYFSLFHSSVENLWLCHNIMFKLNINQKSNTSQRQKGVCSRHWKLLSCILSFTFINYY